MRLILAYTFLLFFLTNISVIAQVSSISGFITDNDTHQPIAGANIQIDSLSLGGISDPNGHFSIRKIPEGIHRLTVSCIGFKTLKQQIKIANEGLILNIVLQISSEELQEVVVTGTGTEHYTKNAPVQTEVISGKALKEFAGRDIEDVLGSLSSSITYNRSDMGSNLKINGSKNDYILILVDGKRMNGDVGGQNDLSRINLSNIERIEIVKGAVSSLYGSDAIGGVINFISKKNKDKFKVSNQTRMGKYGDISQGNNVNLSHKKWNATSSFDYKHTNGWKNTSREWYRNNLFENSVSQTVNRSSNYTISQNLAYQATQKLSITGNATYYEKWTSRPTGEPQWRLYDFYYNNQTYGVGAKYNLTEKNYIAWDASYDKADYSYDYTSREYTDYFDNDNNRIVYYPGDRILQNSQKRLSSNLKGVFYLGEKHTFSSGIEYLFDNLLSPFRLDGDEANNYSLEAYGQDEWEVTPSLNITTGVRVGQHKESGQTFTPKVSAMYKWGKLTIRGTYSNGYKAPTIKELYYHYYASIMSTYKAYYGNTALKPQTSNYYSLNFEYILPRFKVSLTGYANYIRNMIALQTITTSYEDKLQLVEQTMKYVNMAKAYTNGIDFTVDAELPYKIKISGGYSFLDAMAQRTDDEKADNYLKYTYINGTSKHNANFRASWSNTWRRYKFGISINGRYQSKTYYTSDGDAKACQIWRLTTSHRLVNKKQWSLDSDLGIDNIFDYVDQTPFGRNRSNTSPGRTAFASVSITFKSNNN